MSEPVPAAPAATDKDVSAAQVSPPALAAPPTEPAESAESISLLKVLLDSGVIRGFDLQRRARLADRAAFVGAVRGLVESRRVAASGLIDLDTVRRTFFALLPSAYVAAQETVKKYPTVTLQRDAPSRAEIRSDASLVDQQSVAPVPDVSPPTTNAPSWPVRRPAEASKRDRDDAAKPSGAAGAKVYPAPEPVPAHPAELPAPSATAPTDPGIDPVRLSEMLDRLRSEVREQKDRPPPKQSPRRRKRNKAREPDEGRPGPSAG